MEAPTHAGEVAAAGAGCVLVQPVARHQRCGCDAGIQIAGRAVEDEHAEVVLRGVEEVFRALERVEIAEERIEVGGGEDVVGHDVLTGRILLKR